MRRFILFPFLLALSSPAFSLPVDVLEASKAGEAVAELFQSGRYPGIFNEALRSGRYGGRISPIDLRILNFLHTNPQIDAMTFGLHFQDLTEKTRDLIILQFQGKARQAIIDAMDRDRVQMPMGPLWVLKLLGKLQLVAERNVGTSDPEITDKVTSGALLLLRMSEKTLRPSQVKTAYMLYYGLLSFLEENGYPVAARIPLYGGGVELSNGQVSITDLRNRAMMRQIAEILELANQNLAGAQSSHEISEAARSWALLDDLFVEIERVKPAAAQLIRMMEGSQAARHESVKSLQFIYALFFDLRYFRSHFIAAALNEGTRLHFVNDFAQAVEVKLDGIHERLNRLGQEDIQSIEVELKLQLLKAELERFQARVNSIQNRSSHVECTWLPLRETVQSIVSGIPTRPMTYPNFLTFKDTSGNAFVRWVDKRIGKRGKLHPINVYDLRALVLAMVSQFAEIGSGRITVGYHETLGTIHIYVYNGDKETPQFRPSQTVERLAHLFQADVDIVPIQEGNNRFNALKVTLEERTLRELARRTTPQRDTP